MKKLLLVCTKKIAMLLEGHMTEEMREIIGVKDDFEEKIANITKYNMIEDKIEDDEIENKIKDINNDTNNDTIKDIVDDAKGY